jgi:hypothetical protein
MAAIFNSTNLRIDFFRQHKFIGNNAENAGG